MINAKAIRKLGLVILAVCMMLLAQTASAEEAKHSVTIPQTANELWDYLEQLRDESVTDVFVEEGNEAFCSIDGVLFTKDGKEMLLYPSGRTEEEYTVPEGTERVWSAFYYPENLKVLKLPASFLSLWNKEDEETQEYWAGGYDTFDCCSALEKIEVDPDNPVFCAVDGVLFSKDKKKLIACPVCKQGEYEIPDGTEEIGVRAFCHNEKLTSVFIPDSVQVIDDEAFLETIGIKRIRLPKTMKYIGDSAFRDGRELRELEIPEGLTEITAGMLLGNTKLQGTLRIPESITQIGEEALCFLYKVTDVYWPDHDIGFMQYCQNGLELAGDDVKDKIGLVFNWNDWGIADFTVVMHAHEGTPAADWVKYYPHVISPQGVETMDAEGYAKMCTRVMWENGYPEAEICYNPDLKWMAVKPLVAYNLHHAVAVFRQKEQTLLCGFDDLNGEWQLQWVNERFLDDGNLPLMMAFFGEKYLRLILPDVSDPDVDNAVDYWFDAQTLALDDATYVTGYLWISDEDLWVCSVQEHNLAYAYPSHSEKNEEGEYVRVEGEVFCTVSAEDDGYVLSTANRLSVSPEGFVRKSRGE